MSSEEQYSNLIHETTVPVEYLNSVDSHIFRLLAESISHWNKEFNNTRVDYIVVVAHSGSSGVRGVLRRQTIDVYVIGTFRKYFNPTLTVAEALADFYLEYAVLPNITSIPKHRFMKNLATYRKALSKGILLYERR